MKRPIEKLKVDWWWLGEYDDGEGNLERLWSQVGLTMQTENVITGRKLTRVYGTATDGNPTELNQVNGWVVESANTVEARKLGLALPTEATP